MSPSTHDTPKPCYLISLVQRVRRGWFCNGFIYTALKIMNRIRKYQTKRDREIQREREKERECEKKEVAL